MKTSFQKNKPLPKMVRNFDKRNCKFFHFTNVDPKGSACPHFNSKKADSEAAKTLRLLKHRTDG